MKNIYTSLVLVPFLVACGSPAGQSQLHEAWNASNDPSLITGVNYEVEFGRLPLSGAATHKAWSDDYWPTMKGGIAYRWLTREISYGLIDPTGTRDFNYTDLSPAEKYDLMMQRTDFPTVLSERRRTRVLKTVSGSEEYDAGYSIPGWEGLCHGWAPAAMNFKEPKKSVTVDIGSGNKVTFYAADIKALLTYYQQDKGNRSTRTDFVSERCELNFAGLDEQRAAGQITDEEWKAQRESSPCKDMNAASFHLILANELGFKKIGFVVDVTRDDEVWNQPTNSFSSVVTSQSTTPSADAAPGTILEVNIDTRMYYTAEISPTVEASSILEQHKDYSYTLEIDDRGRVIGGRWISEERPDFAWRESAPVFQGYFRALKKLYEQSIDQ